MDTLVSASVSISVIEDSSPMKRGIFNPVFVYAGPSAPPREVAALEATGNALLRTVFVESKAVDPRVLVLSPEHAYVKVILTVTVHYDNGWLWDAAVQAASAALTRARIPTWNAAANTVNSGLTNPIFMGFVPCVHSFYNAALGAPAAALVAPAAGAAAPAPRWRGYGGDVSLSPYSLSANSVGVVASLPGMPAPSAGLPVCLPSCPLCGDWIVVAVASTGGVIDVRRDGGCPLHASEVAALSLAATTEAGEMHAILAKKANEDIEARSKEFRRLILAGVEAETAASMAGHWMTN